MKDRKKEEAPAKKTKAEIKTKIPSSESGAEILKKSATEAKGKSSVSASSASSASSSASSKKTSPPEKKKRAYSRKPAPESPMDESLKSGFIKKYSPDKKTCKVTFTLPLQAAPDAKTVAVAGDFNNWDINANLLEKTNEGDYSITLKLQSGKDYQFKYVIDGTKWENDWKADRYERSSDGSSENSVVSV